MLVSRRMLHRIAVVLFAAASVLPPGWVFCMEATGRVQVEYAPGLCCASAETPGGEAVTEPTANDCDGCRDIALECSAHRKELFEPAATAAAPCVPPVLHFDPPADRNPIATRPVRAHPALSRLSSVVIRR
jgi:hypothetical protein